MASYPKSLLRAFGKCAWRGSMFPRLLIKIRCAPPSCCYFRAQFMFELKPVLPFTEVFLVSLSSLHGHMCQSALASFSLWKAAGPVLCWQGEERVGKTFQLNGHKGDSFVQGQAYRKNKGPLGSGEGVTEWVQARSWHHWCSQDGLVLVWKQAKGRGLSGEGGVKSLLKFRTQPCQPGLWGWWGGWRMSVGTENLQSLLRSRESIFSTKDTF